MIGLDTNVLVRYLAQDDAAQSKKATALMESLSVEPPPFTFRKSRRSRSGRCYGVEREQTKDSIAR